MSELNSSSPEMKDSRINRMAWMFISLSGIFALSFIYLYLKLNEAGIIQPFLFAIFSLIVSIGLLKRKNWARLVIITSLGIAGIYVTGKVLRFYFVEFPMIGESNRPEIAGISLAAQTFINIIALLFVAGFGFLIHDLMSAKVRDRFVSSK